MKKGTKIAIGLGVVAIAGVVLYFVNKKYGWIGGAKSESKSSASGFQCQCIGRFGKPMTLECDSGVRGHRTCEECCQTYDGKPTTSSN